mgnify:CR=1 FL=1
MRLRPVLVVVAYLAAVCLDAATTTALLGRFVEGAVVVRIVGSSLVMKSVDGVVGEANPLASSTGQLLLAVELLNLPAALAFAAAKLPPDPAARWGWRFLYTVAAFRWLPGIHNLLLLVFGVESPLTQLVEVLTSWL